MNKTIQDLYLEKKSVKNFSGDFKVTADILQWAQDGLAFRLRDINDRGLFPFYRLPDGAFTNNLIGAQKNGALTTATLALDNGKDKLTVTGGDVNSYITLGRQFSLQNYRLRVRLLLHSLEATPLLGFRGIWPGGTYSNFNNAQYSAYVNLLTGVMTTTNIGTQDTYNGVTTPVAAGNIVEFEVEGNFEKQRRFIFRKCNSVTGEVSVETRTKLVSSDGDVYHSIHALILAGCSATVLDLSLDILSPGLPVIGVEGDSMGGGVRIPFSDSIRGMLEAKLPIVTFGSSAGSKYLAGGFATLDQVVFMRPKYLVMMYYLEGCFSGFANPANGSYATWTASYIRYVSILKALGITPIFVCPQTWAILDPSGVNCAFFKTFLDTTFPGDIRIFLTASELFYDSTGFHYSGKTNDILTDKIIAALGHSAV